MAPQTSIPLAANILGTIGTVFWCIQLVPQIWYNWKRKKTDGLPGLMMFLWAISAVPCGVYAIIQNFNIPIQIQPQVFCALSLVSWAQILIYNNGYAALKATLLATGLAVVFGGVEVLLILTLRPLYEKGVAWPVMIVGVVAAILLAAGLLPPYSEMWKRKGRVVGIHFGFLTVDWLGAFFSLMGVVAQETFDPLGGCLFIVCIFIEGGIFVSHGIWLLRTRKTRKAAKRAGKSFDDLLDPEEYHVEVQRRGSIAASRDTTEIETERRGSVILVRDLEHGDEMLPGRASFERSASVLKPLDTVMEVPSTKSAKFVGVQVTEEEVQGEGVDTVDYGTMPKASASGSRARPGYERQDSNVSSQTLFKNPGWRD